MKKIIISFILLFIFNVGHAQWSGGIKLGLDVGTPIGKIEEGAKGRLGLGTIGGILTEYRLTDKWGIGMELYYIQKKSSFVTPASVDEYQYLFSPPGPDTEMVWVSAQFDGVVDGSFNNHYIEVPLLAQYYLSDRLAATFGPYMSYLLKGDISGTSTGDVTIGVGVVEVENEAFNESQHLQKIDYGIATGLRYQTEFGMIYELRLTTGLRSVFKETYPLADGTVRNIYLQLTAAYKFALSEGGCDCPKW